MKLNKLKSLLALVPLMVLAACGDKTPKELVMSKTPTASKEFLSNGVEEVTVTRYTDGDTSTFKGVNSNASITVRYLGIDTPESTMGYDKWGKAASIYNKKVLSSAYKIALESPKSTPELDTNGTRYLAFVWYKATETSPYKCLNLEMIEEGYSKSTLDPKNSYESSFKAAEAAARKDKKRIHDPLAEDMYYNEDVKEISISELNANPTKYFNPETEVPTCVTFTATITSLSSGSFVTADVEDETGAKYKVVVGYSGSVFYRIAKVGAKIKFVGWTTGEGSIHGCKSDLVNEDNPLFSREVQ